MRVLDITDKATGEGAWSMHIVWYYDSKWPTLLIPINDEVSF